MQASKILILGDSRAFFAVYSIVLAANLHAFQLDRAGNLTEPLKITEIVKAALKDADCLLLGYEQLCLPGFPIQLFRCAIEYAPQAALDQASASAAADLLKKRARLYWVAFVMPEQVVNGDPPSKHQQQSKAAPLTNLRYNNVKEDKRLSATPQWYEQAENITISAAPNTQLSAEPSLLPGKASGQESGEFLQRSPSNE